MTDNELLGRPLPRSSRTALAALLDYAPPAVLEGVGGEHALRAGEARFGARKLLQSSFPATKVAQPGDKAAFLTYARLAEFKLLVGNPRLAMTRRVATGGLRCSEEPSGRWQFGLPARGGVLNLRNDPLLRAAEALAIHILAGAGLFCLLGLIAAGLGYVSDHLALQWWMIFTLRGLEALLFIVDVCLVAYLVVKAAALFRRKLAAILEES